ncbi:hypothetical protein Q4555_04115 [Octadecabacter sp. 1_MG-2023]|uniref:hypothetical protein n=1 Tax=unclassified Octadecabacter TaxID=196158 RepID=UPI001C080420|nr:MULTISPECIES: hypothetical protein [unclassified Octadecabacter]MBU2992711.1 hypothetical protein [Octadecabacter sp. B2R22]MDO6733838.1 hypothetical protein [Octadecabacter sp. 1_MG-2023]
MKKIAILGASLLVLTACAPQVPDSGAGVGFSDYAEFELERARREAALRGDTVPTTGATTGTFVPPATNGVTTSDLADAGIATTTTTQDPVQQQGALASNPDISDEQDFSAVSGRESIESDAERRARQAAAYQLIEATALPVRNGRVEPNIVLYALQAPNNRGEEVFDRSGLSGDSRFQRNCAKYRTPDEAQRDFLTSGGPQRDRMGIDPDGDGFACGWDPQAFRSVATGN